MAKNKALKTISLLLALCMLLSYTAMGISAAVTKGTADAIVANAVSQIGYYEADDGSTKYGKAFGNAQMTWDLAFILWCAGEAGIPASVIPNYLMYESLRSYYQSNGLYKVSKSHGSSYIPKTGDIVFYSLTSSVSSVTHVGLVETVTSNGGFTAVEGDFKSKVDRATYKYSDKYVIGFASPNYSASSASGKTYKTGHYRLNASMNMRALPNGEIIALVPGEEEVSITAVSGIWGQLTYNGKTGWISLEYSTYTDDAPAKTYKKGVYRVNNELTLYKSKGSTALRTVSASSIINVTLISGKWGKISLNGTAGWVDLTTCTYFTNANNEPVVITVPGSSKTVTKVEIHPTEAQSVDWLVVDVSKWNATYECDWAKMKKAGVEGAIIRIGGRGATGSRVLYSDDTFYQHYKAAKTAGLHVGVYFFSYALTEKEAIEEAQFTIDMLRSCKCELDMPVFIDMEDYGDDMKHHNAGKAVCTKVMDAFCDTIAAAGYYPGIYTNLDFTRNLLEPSVLLGRAIWIAHYSSTCGYTGKYDMWQYSQYGHIDGYTGQNIDLNHCYVNFPALIKGAYEQVETTETVTIPEHETVVDPKHDEPNTTPAGGLEEETTSAPIVDPNPTIVRKWKTTKKATCTKDGEKCLYQNDVLMMKEMITATHTKTVNCALKNTSIMLHAGQMIDPEEFASNFYTESSPYYQSLCRSIETNGGCKFVYCQDCGEILETEYIYCTNNCLHSASTATKKSATCSAEGLKITTCSKCGQSLGETITARKAHTPGTTSISTDTEGRFCSSVSCKVCKAVMSASYVVTAGDVDGDGVLTTSDSRYVLRHSVGLKDSGAAFIKNGDITGDGAIGPADARMILRKAVGLN